MKTIFHQDAISMLAAEALRRADAVGLQSMVHPQTESRESLDQIAIYQLS